MNSGIDLSTATINDAAILTGLIRNSYRDVAQRFGLTPQNCPKHPSNCTDDWIRNDFARGSLKNLKFCLSYETTVA